MNEVKKMGMGKKVGLGCGGAVVLFIIIGALAGRGETSKGATASTPAAAATQTQSAPSAKDVAELGQPAGTVATIKATDLHQLYKQNEIDADNHVKGKIVNIKGVVDSISKDAFGNLYLSIRAGGLLGLHAEFDDNHKAELAMLKAGQQVIVQGRVDGFMMDSVQVKDCQIVK